MRHGDLNKVLESLRPNDLIKLVFKKEKLICLIAVKNMLGDALQAGKNDELMIKQILQCGLWSSDKSDTIIIMPVWEKFNKRIFSKDVHRGLFSAEIIKEGALRKLF